MLEFSILVVAFAVMWLVYTSKKSYYEFQCEVRPLIKEINCIKDEIAYLNWKKYGWADFEFDFGDSDGKL